MENLFEEKIKTLEAHNGILSEKLNRNLSIVALRQARNILQSKIISENQFVGEIDVITQKLSASAKCLKRFLTNFKRKTTIAIFSRPRKVLLPVHVEYRTHLKSTNKGGSQNSFGRLCSQNSQHNTLDLLGLMTRLDMLIIYGTQILCMLIDTCALTSRYLNENILQ